MPGPIIADPTPAWLKPQNASVLDSPITKALRTLAGLIGANDPQSQVMGVMAGVDVPEKAALTAIGKAIKAYHGSPHDFDKFSLSKIGTGEGAQAYGHGLYFAENEGVARSYRDALAMGDPSGVKQTVAGQWDRASLNAAGGALKEAGGDVPAAIEVLKRRNAKLPNAPDKQAIERLEAGVYAPDPNGPGRVYEVQINADPEQLIDYDKPISQQTPQAQEALKAMWRKAGKSFPGALDPNADPIAGQVQHLYKSHRGGNAAAVTEEFKAAGIPGIKYLDGGSRAAGDGSRNYVIFDDSLIDILKKYGVALPVIEGLRRKASANGGKLERADVEGVM